MTVEVKGRWRWLQLGQRYSWLTYCARYERLASSGSDARRSFDPRHRGTMAASGAAPGAFLNPLPLLGPPRIFCWPGAWGRAFAVLFSLPLRTFRRRSVAGPCPCTTAATARSASPWISTRMSLPPCTPWRVSHGSGARAASTTARRPGTVTLFSRALCAGCSASGVAWPFTSGSCTPLRSSRCGDWPGAVSLARLGPVPRSPWRHRT